MQYVVILFVPLLASILVWSCFWKLVGLCFTGVLFATHTFWGYDIMSLAMICTFPTMILLCIAAFAAHVIYGVIMFVNVMLSMVLASHAAAGNFKQLAMIFTSAFC